MTQDLSVTIIQGIPESMRETAVDLYAEAFGKQFSVAVPDPESRRKLLLSSLNLTSGFAAIIDNQLVGIAGYKTQSESFTDGMTFEVLFESVGETQGVWAASIFSLYERTLEADELMIDGIAVKSSTRGRGIGTKLLNAVVSFAKESGFLSVRLDVVDTNSAAQRLYERHQFTVTSTESFSTLNWLVGFDAMHTLTRKISATSAEESSL
ncbi:MAG: GNAT family N-acetyltransferase [Fuerstiella sp.]